MRPLNCYSERILRSTDGGADRLASEFGKILDAGFGILDKKIKYPVSSIQYHFHQKQWDGVYIISSV